MEDYTDQYQTMVAAYWQDRKQLDKQDAFVKCIADEFPGVPHRYCENHFFRDLAKPMLEMALRTKRPCPRRTAR